MLAELVLSTAEKHKQRTAMVISNRDFTIFSCLLMEMLLSNAGPATDTDPFHKMFRYTGLGVPVVCRINLKPLCDLCELSASVVSLHRETITTETQRPLRIHSERQASNFPTDSFGVIL